MEMKNIYFLKPVIRRATRVSSTSAALIDHMWISKITTLLDSGIVMNTTTDNFPTFVVTSLKLSHLG